MRLTMRIMRLTMITMMTMLYDDNEEGLDDDADERIRVVLTRRRSV